MIYLYASIYHVYPAISRNRLCFLRTGGSFRSVCHLPRISTSQTHDVDVNRQNFAWENEYELGQSMSVGMAKRRALSTRTYPHVVCSAWVLRNPFYFLVNVALPNMLFAAMAGLQFFVDVDKVADRASISLTLLLVCASYFQFSSSLVPRLGYLTILDKHSLWCIFLVIVMVFWVGVINLVRYHTVSRQGIAMPSWLLLSSQYLDRLLGMLSLTNYATS